MRRGDDRARANQPQGTDRQRDTDGRDSPPSASVERTRHDPCVEHSNVPGAALARGMGHEASHPRLNRTDCRRAVSRRPHRPRRPGSGTRRRQADGATSEGPRFMAKPARLRRRGARRQDARISCGTPRAPDVFGARKKIAPRRTGATRCCSPSTTFGLIPRHARALDVGASRATAAASSASPGPARLPAHHLGPGRPYARISSASRGRRRRPLDEDRCTALARYLARLHAERLDAPLVYRRSVRDLIGTERASSA
jgi:hypothetical protein